MFRSGEVENPVVRPDRPRRKRLEPCVAAPPIQPPRPRTAAAEGLLEQLRSRGASFTHELKVRCELSDEACCEALGELVSSGLVSSDGFAGLRAIAASTPARRRGIDLAGRWFALDPVARTVQDDTRPSSAAMSDVGLHGSIAATREEAVLTLAWTLLARYGVVFRRLLARE